jgi:uncharacterized protein involved in exopolysaccharide biosynthesis
MPLSRLRLVELFLTTVHADLEFEHNRIGRIGELVAELNTGHDATEAQAFGLLRQLVQQAQRATEQYQADLTAARKHLQELRDLLQPETSVG